MAPAGPVQRLTDFAIAVRNPQCGGAFQGFFLGILDGTAFATKSGMDVVKKFAVDGVMGVLGNPFMPYIALLFALLRSL
jgi:hypothetical protein